jgi:hypothetical protein
MCTTRGEERWVDRGDGGGEKNERRATRDERIERRSCAQKVLSQTIFNGAAMVDYVALQYFGQH